MKLAATPETFNPVVVDFYEQVGYLPDAVVNYLLLLGWSLDDKTEIMTRAQMIENFSLERVNPAPASFDPTKLLAFQAQYMRDLPLADKVAGVLPFLERAGLADGARLRRHPRLRRPHRRGARRSHQGVRRHPAAGAVLLRATRSRSTTRRSPSACSRPAPSIAWPTTAAGSRTRPRSTRRRWKKPRRS